LETKFLRTPTSLDSFICFLDFLSQRLLSPKQCLLHFGGQFMGLSLRIRGGRGLLRVRHVSLGYNLLDLMRLVIVCHAASSSRLSKSVAIGRHET
jgi:hypothetical protein